MHHFIDFRPPRIAVGFVLIALVANALQPLTLHASLPLAATLTGAIGCLVMIRGWWLFKQFGTAICPTATASTLVTQDVYSISRNPMYLGIFLMLCALGILTGSAPFYVAAAGYWVVMDRAFCPYEERKSLQEFDAEYLAYTQRVRRWL
jgi:protein-S-isoprenylcysteine O-methyltransferase Ste14